MTVVGTGRPEPLATGSVDGFAAIGVEPAGAESHDAATSAMAAKMARPRRFTGRSIRSAFSPVDAADPTAQDVIWEIDPNTGTATVAGQLPVGLSDASAVVVNGIGYLLGGETDTFEATITAITLA